MTRPIIHEHNSETDETVDREMTDSEFAEWQKNQAAALKIEAEGTAKAEAKAALLEKLGISAEEAALLLG